MKSLRMGNEQPFCFDIITGIPCDVKAHQKVLF